MPLEIKRGREYQLWFDAGVVVRRLIDYGSTHPLRLDEPFRASVEFQNKAVREGLAGIVEVRGAGRDSTLNVSYPLTGFDSDLYQLISERKPQLAGTELAELLAKVVSILIEVGSRFGRTHGRLRLHSVLFKQPVTGPKSVALTDFIKSAAAQPVAARPWEFETDDLKSFGRLILRLANSNLDQPINRNDLPSENDPQARQRFGEQWREWRKIADNLLTTHETNVIKSLDDLLAQIPGQHRRPKVDQSIAFAPLRPYPKAGETVPIGAAATSGLPVRFSVEGPARVIGTNLAIDDTGTITIRAFQNGNAEYNPAPEVTQTVVVKESQTIHFEPPEDIRFSLHPIQLQVSASSGLKVDLSRISGPARLDVTTLIPTSAGVVKIKASQAGDDRFYPVEQVLELPIAKARQTISFPSIADKFEDDPPFSIEAHADSPLGVTFEITDGPARISGNTLSLRGRGRVTVRASQSGDNDYEAAPDVTQCFEVRERVTQARQTISFDPIGDKPIDAPPFEINVTTSSGQPVELRVLSGPATIQGRRLTLTGIGRVTIQASQSSSERFQAAEATQSFNVTRLRQTVALSPIENKLAGDVPFPIEARASSGLPVLLTVVTGPAVIRNSLVSLTGVGQVIVKAEQPGNERYEKAEITSTFSVGLKPQTITFTPVSGKTFGDAQFEVQATSTSGLPVVIAVESGPATLIGSQVKLTGAGLVKIKATQSGNGGYQPAQATLSIQVSKARQTILFDSPGEKVFGTAPFGLMARVNSSLPVSFEIIDGPARISGGLVTLLGTGNVRIKAVQPGNENFLPAEAGQQFTVGPASQTIDFPAPSRPIAFGETFSLEARASSGLLISFTVVSGPAQLTGSQLAARGVGVVIVKASQAGDANHRPAVDVVQSFHVVKARQTIAFQGWPAELPVGGSFRAKASASSELPVVVESANSSLATLQGDLLTATKAGALKLKATQAGNERYEPAEAEHTLRILKRPQQISLEDPGHHHVGDSPFLVRASADSSLDVLLEVTGPARIRGNEITITGAGTVEIKATQAGTDTYAPAPEVKRTFRVSKRAQRIHFGELEDRKVGDPPFSLQASADSNLPVVFEVVSGPATIDGDTLTVTGRGAITIAARQPGNHLYDPAEETARSFTAKDPKRARVLIYATLAPILLAGIVAAVIVISNGRKETEAALQKIRELIQQDKPLQAIQALKNARISQLKREQLELALRTAPAPLINPPTIEVVQGSTTKATLRLTLPDDLPERELMEKLTWQIGVKPQKANGVSLVANTNQLAVNQELSLSISAKAGGNAIETNSPFYLTVSNEVTGAKYDMTVRVKLPDLPTLAMPIIEPKEGSYPDSVKVSLYSSNKEVSIRYTLDETEPANNSSLYSSPFKLDTSTTIKAKAFKSGANPSLTASTTFTVTNSPILPEPMISPDGGSHRDGVEVRLSSTESGVTIRYTLNNTDPTETSDAYSNSTPIRLYQNRTVKARAFMAGAKPSVVKSARFMVTNTPVLPAPSIAPPSGVYWDSVPVVLSHQDTSAKIFYTTNGVEPTNTTTTSALYPNAPFPLATITLVKARAFRDGFKPSAVVSNLFTVKPKSPLPDPVISPKEGNYIDFVDVTLSIETAGAEIFYTTNGSEPRRTSTPSRQSLRLTNTALVKAQAFHDDYTPSKVVSKLFTVAPRRALYQPTITPAEGNFTNSIQVTLTSEEPGVRIHYTLNDAEPTEKSLPYSYPIPLTNSTIVTAKAFKDGFNPSPPAKADFKIVRTTDSHIDNEKRETEIMVDLFRVWFGVDPARKKNSLSALTAFAQNKKLERPEQFPPGSLNRQSVNYYSTRANALRELCVKLGLMSQAQSEEFFERVTINIKRLSN